MIVLQIEPVEQEAYRSLQSDFPDRLLEFQIGTTLPLGVALLKRVRIPRNDEVFAADDVSTWAIRATLETEVVASLETDSAAPAATVTLVQQGDATHNHKVSVALPTLRYGGVWTFVVAGVESGPIGYGDNEAEVKAIVGAISGVGAANVAVNQTDDDTFLIEFVGARALQAISGITAHGNTLEVLTVKSGLLDFRTEGVAALVPSGDAQAVVSFSVLGTPAAGTEQVLLRRDVVLLAATGDFVTTETTAAKKYRAVLTQAGTAAPVATILENTFGAAIVWTRSGAGDYRGTLTGAFPAGKTFLENQTLSGGVQFTRLDTGHVKILAAGGDDTLTEFSIEILVYP